MCTVHCGADTSIPNLNENWKAGLNFGVSDSYSAAASRVSSVLEKLKSRGTNAGSLCRLCFHRYLLPSPQDVIQAKDEGASRRSGISDQRLGCSLKKSLRSLGASVERGKTSEGSPFSAWPGLDGPQARTYRLESPLSIAHPLSHSPTLPLCRVSQEKESFRLGIVH